MIEDMFICLAILTALLLLLGLCHLLGLGVMRVMDRRTGKKRLYVVKDDPDDRYDIDLGRLKP